MKKKTVILFFCDTRLCKVAELSTQFDGKTGKLFSEMSMIQYTRFFLQ